MRDTRRNPMSRQGFTLVELVVVVTILALLMGLFVPKIFKGTQRAQIQITQMQLKKLQAKLDQAALDTGRYPTNDEGLLVLVQSNPGVENWHGPYVEKEDLKDPWKRTFQYRRPCQHGGLHEYDLFSFGPNGQEDPGEGGDDVRNWQ